MGYQKISFAILRSKLDRTYLSNVICNKKNELKTDD